MKDDLKLMLVSKDESLISNLERVFVERNFHVTSVIEVDFLLSAAYEHSPDVLIFDCRENIEHIEDVVAGLKSDNIFIRRPILALVSDKSLDGDQWKQTRFDDIIVLPFCYSEFFCRIDLATSRIKRISDNSLLTNLPGPLSIQQEVEFSIGQQKAFLLVDINNLQPYNTVYGYNKGDEAITVLGRIVANVIQAIPGAFVGHFGSDDFALVVPLPVAEKVAADIIAQFGEMNQFFFPKEDLDKGFYMAHNRKGNFARYNLLSVVIAIIPLDTKAIDHYGRVMASARDIITFIGRKGNSGFFFERRGH